MHFTALHGSETIFINNLFSTLSKKALNIFIFTLFFVICVEMLTSIFILKVHKVYFFFSLCCPSKMSNRLICLNNCFFFFDFPNRFLSGIVNK